MCLTKDLVYQAKVKTKDNNDIKTYIGMTATTFKERYRNHKKSFNDINIAHGMIERADVLC
jgi:hypothetical protein